MRRWRRGSPTPTSMAGRSISSWPRSESRSRSEPGRAQSRADAACGIRAERANANAVARSRCPDAHAGGRDAARSSRRCRPPGIADIPRRGGRALSAGRRAAARLARQAWNKRHDAGPAAHIAHVQGQRADGRGDATGRGRAHDGKPPHWRRGGGADGRVFRRAGQRSGPHRFPARSPAERRNRYGSAVAGRRVRSSARAAAVGNSRRRRHAAPGRAPRNRCRRTQPNRRLPPKAIPRERCFACVPS